MDKLESRLQKEGIIIKRQEPMTKHTTFRIGGMAEYFIEVSDSKQLQKIISICDELKIVYTVIGWGSNILVSDDGISGVVIKNSSQKMEIIDKKPKDEQKTKINTKKLDIRYTEANAKERGIYTFSDLDYDESNLPIVKVLADSGVGLINLINWSIGQGLTGLQWFSGIPGTLGGAIINNIHGGTHLFEEVLESIKVYEKKSQRAGSLLPEDIALKYDHSSLYKTGDIILDATLRLRKGDKEKAIYTAKEWYKRKSIQPRITPGCVWKNISPEEQKKLGFETNATGYIIDQKLGWRGKKRVGGAVISDKHANFIENVSNATARDVLKIMKEVRDEVQNRFGILLESEIIFLGFGAKSLDEILDNLKL